MTQPKDPVEMAAEKLVDTYRKSYEIESEPENYMHEGLNSLEFASHLEKDIVKVLRAEGDRMRAEILTKDIEELEGMIPTKDTKVIIETRGRDPHDTTPQSLVAMGYATAVGKLLTRKKEALEAISNDE